MPYIANTPEDQKEMLRQIGLETVDQLFETIPEPLRLGRHLDVPDALTELELTRHMIQLGENNVSSPKKVCFLGGGSYDHFVPAVVDTIASRNEFYTSYTPYQAEASQGSLQAFFEFQTLLCQLTGMDVANASLYDGISAAAEAALMAIGVTKRDRSIVVAETLHPQARAVLQTYLDNWDTEIVTVPAHNGVTDLQILADAVDDGCAAVMVQQPNFFGALEPVAEISKIARQHGALMVASVDPTSLGLLKRPAEYEADIVIGEAQGLGIPMQFGGPYLGVIACRDKYVRRLPGRVVGKTVDRNGETTYVLTLQTREQHIRREKATSNICTNQGLLALRATAYLAAMGPEGMRELATCCCQNSHYLAQRLVNIDGIELKFSSPFFKEFAVSVPLPPRELLGELRALGYLAGLDLGRWYPELSDCLLIAVTEKRTRQDMDGLVDALQFILKSSRIGKKDARSPIN